MAEEKTKRLSCYDCTKIGVTCEAQHPPNKECFSQEETEKRFSCYECTKLGVTCGALHPPNEECFSPRISLEDRKYLHFNKKKAKKSKLKI